MEQIFSIYFILTISKFYKKTYKLLKKKINNLGLDFDEDKTRPIEPCRFTSEIFKKNSNEETHKAFQLLWNN